MNLHPTHQLEPGRYLLDTIGRLQPLDARDLIDTVAIVTVCPKAQPSAERVRAECAGEASAREERFREARRLTAAHPLDAAASERAKPLRDLARRRAAPSPPEPSAAPDDEDEAYHEFAAKLAEVKARREAGEAVVRKKARPKTNGAKLADALARRPRKTIEPEKKPPTRRALGPGECHRCGIPGFRGCDHFLPFEGS